MMYQDVTHVSLDEFRKKTKGKSLVLLYPWTPYRNLFLSHFLADDKAGIVYYCVPHPVKNVRDWLADMVTTLGATIPNFGEKLKEAFKKKSPSAELLAESLASDLLASGQKNIILYVDQLDYVPFDEKFNDFIINFIDNLPDGIQWVISSRVLAYQTWREYVANGMAVVLGTERRANDVIFTIEEQIKPQLEVYAFGRGHAVVNGEEITSWDGALPRNLFFYFVDNPLLTRDDIFNTFWNNLPVKEATNVFHVTKRKISERITLWDGEKENSYELTTYASGFYTPSPMVVRHYDVAEFQSAVDTAMLTEDENLKEQLYRYAIDLYKSPFLDKMENRLEQKDENHRVAQWIRARRAELQQLYAQSLIGMGRICKGRNDLVPALGYFNRAVKELPEREDIHREILGLYYQLGMQADVERQYAFLKETLASRLGIAPSPITAELYQMLTHG
ncbi:MAG: bacterial transcriptional activator domain-containing protein [bacterium]|nr:bacterial transcriptional activator domain-containing protein [bacterium]